MISSARRTTLQTREQEVRVGISDEIIGRLISEGHLCAADLRCLDQETRTTIKKLCLSACRKNFCNRSFGLKLSAGSQAANAQPMVLIASG